MGILVYSLSWVMQGLYHEPYVRPEPGSGIGFVSRVLLGLGALDSRPSFRRVFLACSLRPPSVHLDWAFAGLGVEGSRVLGFRVEGLRVMFLG